MQSLLGVLAGSIFGVGLVLSGMTQPAKVMAFLDFTGNWDPSLAFVMGGAIAVYAPLYQYITRRTTPVYAQKFMLIASRQVDAPLLLGAGVFGIGWGLAGFCPGPGIVAAGGGSSTGIVFALSMILGMVLFEIYAHIRHSIELRSQQGASAGA